MGLGPGNYSRKIFDYLADSDRANFMTDKAGKPIASWQHLHNLYLQILVDLGSVGFALWAGGLGILVWRALRVNQNASSGVLSVNSVLSVSIIAFLVHNLVDIVTVNSFDMVFAILLATATYSDARSLKETGV